MPGGAPNTLHYWWLADWHARFPEAQVYAVPGTGRTLTGRRTKRPLPPHHDPTDTPPKAWGHTLDQTMVPGGVLSEAVFFHRPSRTLTLTDLIENFEPRRIRSLFWRWTMQLFGAADPRTARRLTTCSSHSGAIATTCARRWSA